MPEAAGAAPSAVDKYKVRHALSPRPLITVAIDFAKNVLAVSSRSSPSLPRSILVERAWLYLTIRARSWSETGASLNAPVSVLLRNYIEGLECTNLGSARAVAANDKATWTLL